MAKGQKQPFASGLLAINDGVPRRASVSAHHTDRWPCRRPISTLNRLYFGIADGPVSASPTALCSVWV